MFCILYGSARCFVALLAEGVDRNGENTTVSANISASPSSRRAWIEIDQSWPQMEQSAVALLAEGVDRNLMAAIILCRSSRRPPRGGRG